MSAQAKPRGVAKSEAKTNCQGNRCEAKTRCKGNSCEDKTRCKGNGCEAKTTRPQSFALQL